eukprot:758674-Hanusia_phi.AAC.1
MMLEDDDDSADHLHHPDFLDRVGLPLCFSCDAFDRELNSENAGVPRSATQRYPSYRLENLGLEIELVPTLGVIFKDVNGKFRHGIIRAIREGSISVYILYNKDTLLEVSENLRMNSQTMRMIRSLEAFECFQSMYTDEFTLEDVC